jgi:hypothetical protein
LENPESSLGQAAAPFLPSLPAAIFGAAVARSVRPQSFYTTALLPWFLGSLAASHKIADEARHALKRALLTVTGSSMEAVGGRGVQGVRAQVTTPEVGVQEVR